jgi:proteasome lid subunit RPN8/RPN11
VEDVFTLVAELVALAKTMARQTKLTVEMARNKPWAEDYKCAICLNMAEKPLQCSVCDHLACTQCLTGWHARQAGANRELCTNKCPGAVLKRPRLSAKWFGDAPFDCQRCAAIFPFKDRDRHVDCGVVVQCSRCAPAAAFATGDDLAAHWLTTCPATLVECSRCQAHVVRAETDQHRCYDLKLLFCPREVHCKFQRLAANNTRDGLETGAYLAGERRGDHLVITALVVPPQESLPNKFIEHEGASCVMQAVYAAEGLDVFGWIHSHPRHENFLSSIDLHNHLYSQRMLPEFAAIVFAPDAELPFQAWRIKGGSHAAQIDACPKGGFHNDHRDSFEACRHLEYWDGPCAVHDLRAQAGGREGEEDDAGAAPPLHDGDVRAARAHK